MVRVGALADSIECAERGVKRHPTRDTVTTDGTRYGKRVKLTIAPLLWSLFVLMVAWSVVSDIKKPSERPPMGLHQR